MKFTREQYNENIGPWYLDDFPISNDDDFMFDLFNLLPNNYQGTALAWGASDTEFKEGVFKYLILVCFQLLTTHEFYKQELHELEHLSIEFIAQKITERQLTI